jgi:hypothetical protein
MGQNGYWTSSNGQYSQMKVYDIDRDFDSDFDKWLKVKVRAIRKF